MTTWEPDRFTITRLRPGYTKAEVDEFIAQIEGTLGRAMPPDRPVTVDEVRNVRFSTTRLRPDMTSERWTPRWSGIRPNWRPARLSTVHTHACRRGVHPFTMAGIMR